jgi:hypothetical protein
MSDAGGESGKLQRTPSGAPGCACKRSKMANFGRNWTDWPRPRLSPCCRVASMCTARRRPCSTLHKQCSTPGTLRLASLLGLWQQIEFELRSTTRRSGCVLRAPYLISDGGMELRSRKKGSASQQEPSGRPAKRDRTRSAAKRAISKPPAPERPSRKTRASSPGDQGQAGPSQEPHAALRTTEPEEQHADNDTAAGTALRNTGGHTSGLKSASRRLKEELAAMPSDGGAEAPGQQVCTDCDINSVVACFVYCNMSDYGRSLF